MDIGQYSIVLGFNDGVPPLVLSLLVIRIDDWFALDGEVVVVGPRQWRRAIPFEKIVVDSGEDPDDSGDLC